ncbi:lytic transglycosylase domain-containing protein [Acidimicrobiia bacterium EGI L10123]|uniref:transglycosylase SLT domain-containing protein n=1 Tax=Salinilacustrithrix flava TaxID=2957203 RepID=UPI003D7C24C5|nr:lytic transglycosylase domain-containing protein [Acidimicrobiia bacterium EGI L10123]
MSKTTIRAAAGLAIALSLAAFTWPAAGADDAGRSGQVVQTAAADAPTDVDGVAVRDALTDVGDRIAAEAVAAQEARDLEVLAAAIEAENLQRLAAAIEAENLARLAAAIEANEAREAEQRRAAAAATAPAGSLEGIIHRHFGSAAPAAIRIAKCESGMNPGAVSPTNDHGLFQINIVHRGQFEAVTGAPWSSVYDPELNTIYARHLYAQQGWGPWTCAR